MRFELLKIVRRNASFVFSNNWLCYRFDILLSLKLEFRFVIVADLLICLIGEWRRCDFSIFGDTGEAEWGWGLLWRIDEGILSGLLLILGIASWA